MRTSAQMISAWRHRGGIEEGASPHLHKREISFIVHSQKPNAHFLGSASLRIGNVNNDRLLSIGANKSMAATKKKTPTLLSGNNGCTGSVGWQSYDGMGQF